jgi:hypothetical protein
VFKGSSSEITVEIRKLIISSWREGCPVGLGDLRLLSLDHWGFDGAVHRGELMVHRDQATKVLDAMRGIFDSRFPIEKMELVDIYGASDDRSMAANNTSGFNCRTNSSGSWSEHAFGRAIDINPIQNPFVSAGGDVDPPAGRSYTDRTRDSKGMIHPDDSVVNAFARIGWRWGGYWRMSKDFQHFSSNGR